MKQKSPNLYYALIWGLGIYALRTFMNNPDTRLQIIGSVVLAYIIVILNQKIVTEKIRNHKLLRHIVPVVLMNLVLITTGALLAVANGFSFSKIDLSNLTLTGGGYLVFNLIIIIIYQYQYRLNKRHLNHLLQLKKAQLDV